MSIFAGLTGFLGGLCAVMGILTAVDVVPLLNAEFTWTFWFMLAAVLLLMSIALTVGRGGGGYE